MDIEKRGSIFILEGGECSGKTTIAKFLTSTIDNLVYLREPGGNPVSEKIRDVIVNNEMSDWAEAYLFMASRANLIQNTIIPLINEGKNVLLDRFHLSSVVYQGIVKGCGKDAILEMNIDLFRRLNIFEDIAHTYVLNSDIWTLQERMKDRPENNKFEKYELEFHEAVFKAYRDLTEESYDISPWDCTLPETPDKIRTDITRRLDMIHARRNMQHKVMV